MSKSPVVPKKKLRKIAKVVVSGERKPPAKFHLDKRALMLVSAITGGPDDLLTTAQTAGVLGVSMAWLETQRARGEGPPFRRLALRLIRYRRGDIVAWLDERSHHAISEYA